MWLLNTETLKLEEHVDPSTIEYAILSHTWEDDEVSFRDIFDLELARSKAGFAKIAKTCELARYMGIRLAWVDTCCIDKSSSAELSEAINSMFQWYKLSQVCYVLLSDLIIGETSGLDSHAMRPADEDAFARCRWFTRGWTLQELIAPESVEFYDSQWDFIGRKSGLRKLLERVTRINSDVLHSSSVLRVTPVAVKMSWAAGRRTKRSEDMAYCLLGMFDINMPLIYGEGPKAFRRLQEEIVKETNDLSLFAWTAPKPAMHSQMLRGIFADSPEEFRDCSRLSWDGRRGSRPEYSLTNKGVRFKTFLQKHGHGIYVMPLGLENSNRGINNGVGIYLMRTLDGFIRSSPSTTMLTDAVVSLDKDVRFFTIFVRKSIARPISAVLELQLERSFTIRNNISAPLRIKRPKEHPNQLWDDFYNTFFKGHPWGDFTASLGITVCRDDKQFNEEFPLTATVRFESLTGNAFATIHSNGTPAPDRLVGNTAPGRLIDPAIEGSTLIENSWPDFSLVDSNGSTQEIYFWDTQSLNSKAVKFVKFRVQLESEKPSHVPAMKEVVLSGEVSEMELSKALAMIRKVSDAP